MEIGSKAKVISGPFKGREIEIIGIQVFGNDGVSTMLADLEQVEPTQTVFVFPIKGARVNTVINVDYGDFDDFINEIKK